jgi:prepilin peptidase CpaA
MAAADLAKWLSIWALVVAAVAAACDWLTRRIPVALTAGSLVLAVAVHAALAPPDMRLRSAGWSLLGAAACGVPPLLLWFTGSVGGGDAKLMACLGAILGPARGLQAIFLALAFAGSAILLRWAWDGVLMRSVGSGLAVAVSPLLPARRRHAARPELGAALRFGPFALGGVVVANLVNGGLL